MCVCTGHHNALSARGIGVKPDSFLYSPLPVSCSSLLFCFGRWQTFKMKIIVVFAVLLLAVVIFLLACFAGGQNCTKKHSA